MSLDSRSPIHTRRRLDRRRRSVAVVRREPCAVRGSRDVRIDRGSQCGARSVARRRALGAARRMRGLRGAAGVGPGAWLGAQGRGPRARGTPIPRLHERLCLHDAGGGHDSERRAHVGRHRSDDDHVSDGHSAHSYQGVGRGLLEVPPHLFGRHRAGIGRDRAGLFRLRGNRRRCPAIAELDRASRRRTLAPPRAPAAGVRVPSRRLWHESGPGAHAHVAARRALGGTVADLRDDVRRAAGGGDVRDRAMEGRD